MTHGYIYRIHQHQALATSVQTSPRLPGPAVETPEVIPVHVRIRQSDVGVLYKPSDGIQKTPLAMYEAGEHLDCYC